MEVLVPFFFLKKKKKKRKEKRVDCSIEAPTGCYLRFWGTCSGGL
jgi:hypothetical protein